MSTDNVFGRPITEGDRIIRASEAYEKMNDGRNLEALEYLQREKGQFVGRISALSMIYNATGEPIKFFSNHDWHGKIFHSYPVKMENGQWGAFLHTDVHPVNDGSEAAVVYSGKTGTNNDCDILLAHYIPSTGDNHAYTDIGPKGHFNDWNAIQRELENSSFVTSASQQGIGSFALIEIGFSPYRKVILTLNSQTKEGSALGM